METVPGEAILGRFELLETLGRGGMGVVYRALDRDRGVHIALKTLRTLAPDRVLRFKAEFRALRDLRHPNLVELGELYLGQARALVFYIRDNDWRGCLEAMDDLQALWLESGRGPGWETDLCTHFELASYQLLGEYDEMARGVSNALRDAERSGNLYLEVSLRVRFTGRHLVRGRIEDAASDVADALASWLPESDRFGNQRAWALFSRSRIGLCSGEFPRFVPDLDPEWRNMHRSLLARVPLLRLEWYPTYGAYLCAKALLERRRGRPSEHARLCRKARRYAVALSKMRNPGAPQSEALLRAAIAGVCDDAERALTETRRALEEARAFPTLVFEWPLQLRLGQLLGGDEGAALIAEAEREAAVRGITDLHRFAEIAIPTEWVAN